MRRITTYIYKGRKFEIGYGTINPSGTINGVYREYTKTGYVGIEHTDMVDEKTSKAGMTPRQMNFAEKMEDTIKYINQKVDTQEWCKAHPDATDEEFYRWVACYLNPDLCI